MITPSQLRLVEDLVDGTVDEIAPSIDDETNRITYPAVAEYTDSPAETIQTLDDAGVIEHTDSRDCTVVLSDPHETIEISLESYGVSEVGEDWLSGRLSARQATADLLERRGFDVTEDTEITGESGETYPFHVHAADAVLGLDLGVSLTETVSTADVVSVASVATDTGVRPLLVTMSAPDDDDRSFASQHGVGIIRADAGSPDEEALSAATEAAEAED